METSPNGAPVSIGKTVAAIEIKCPFPSENKMPVHYSLPPYYVCQCLAEMVILETNTLIYVSYSKQSATFFNVQFDSELWDMLMVKTSHLYDQPHPLPPKKMRSCTGPADKFSEFCCKQCHLLCEFPSIELEDSGYSQICKDIPFQFADHKLAHDEQVTCTVDEAILTTENALKVVDNGHYRLRKRAAEVMVWGLANKDKNSKLEIPCFLPIAYGLKDYRLTSQAFRNATEKVLKECRQRGIRVLSFATDGQWIQNMVRDRNKKPLTVYELQKDVWDNVQKLTKAEPVRTISSLNKITGNPDEMLSALQVDFIVKNISQGKCETVLYVKSKDIAFEKISTSTDKRVCLPPKTSIKKGTENQEPSTHALERIDTD